MFSQIPKPFESFDTTEEIKRHFSEVDRVYREWHLWPFKWTVCSLETGSKVYLLEFRMFRGFTLTLSAFWKR